MLKAKDPKSGLMVEPNPGARAECQFCAAVVIAKCGEVLGWHWSHYAHESCQEWENAERLERMAERERSKMEPRRLCTSCVEWSRGCQSLEPIAHTWLHAWGGSDAGVCWFYAGAPQCPAWRWDRPFSKTHNQNPVKSQWRLRTAGARNT